MTLDATTVPIPGRAEIEAAGIRLIVGVPLGRGVDSTCFIGLWNVARHGYHIAPLIYGRTDANRNRMAHAMLESEYTHILMLDADHHHTPDIPGRLARWVIDDPDRLIVAGLNFRRGSPFEALAFDRVGDKLEHITQWGDDLFEVEATGHGSTLISREVFERIPPPWWAYPYNHASKGVYPSEDMFFCMQARMDDIKIFVDPSAVSPHLTQYWVDAETSKAARMAVGLESDPTPSPNGALTPSKKPATRRKSKKRIRAKGKRVTAKVGK